MCDELGQFVNGTFDVRLLLPKLCDPLLAALHRDTPLLHPSVIQIVEVDHLPNLGQTETDILGAHDPGKPRTIPPRIYPGQAGPLRSDQPFGFIMAQGASGNTELAGQVRNRISFALVRVRTVQMGSPRRVALDPFRLSCNHRDKANAPYVNVNLQFGRERPRPGCDRSKTFPQCDTQGPPA